MCECSQLKLLFKILLHFWRTPKSFEGVFVADVWQCANRQWGGGTMCGKTTRAYLMFRICETSQSPYSMCKSWRILYLPNHVTYTQFHFLLQICSGFLFEGSAKSSLLETANIYTQHCVSPEPKIHMYMV